LTSPAASNRTLIQILKADPGPLRVETAQDEVAKLRQLQALDLPPTLFTGIPPRVLHTLRQRVAAEEPHELRRHPAPLRATLLAAFTWVRAQEVTDTLTDLLIKMIHHVGIRADWRVDKDVRQEIKRFANKNGMLRQLAEAVVEHPDGIIREVIFPIVDEATLHELIADLRATSRAYRRQVQTVMRRSYGHHYRRMVPPLLQALTFRSNNAIHRPLIQALELLRRYDGKDSSHYDADDAVPIDGVVPNVWRDLVVEKERNGTMCIYSQLKSCSASEVAAAITRVIRHCTAMSVNRHYVDSHGQSEVAFGFSFLLGYDLCPRLKPIHKQKLYIPTSAHAERYPHLSLIVKRAIDWDLIRRQYVVLRGVQQKCS